MSLIYVITLFDRAEFMSLIYVITLFDRASAEGDEGSVKGCVK